MKNINFYIGVLILSITTSSSVFAEEGLSVVPINVQLETNNEIQVDTTPINASGQVNVQIKSEAKNNASDTAKTKEENNTKGETISASHMSVVATFVQALLKVADRSSSIGADVKLVAQQQQDSADKTVEASKKIETRSKIKTFFVGTDYKNLGVIRSEMVKTEARIAKIEALMNKTSSTSIKAELAAQLDVLKAEQVKINAFVEANSKVFSLFGWLSKKD